MLPSLLLLPAPPLCHWSSVSSNSGSSCSPCSDHPPWRSFAARTNAHHTAYTDNNTTAQVLSGGKLGRNVLSSSIDWIPRLAILSAKFWFRKAAGTGEQTKRLLHEANVPSGASASVRASHCPAKHALKLVRPSQQLRSIHICASHRHSRTCSSPRYGRFCSDPSAWKLWQARMSNIATPTCWLTLNIEKAGGPRPPEGALGPSGSGDTFSRRLI